MWLHCKGCMDGTTQCVPPLQCLSPHTARMPQILLLMGYWFDCVLVKRSSSCLPSYSSCSSQTVFSKKSHPRRCLPSGTAWQLCPAPRPTVTWVVMLPSGDHGPSDAAVSRVSLRWRVRSACPMAIQNTGWPP